MQNDDNRTQEQREADELKRVEEAKVKPVETHENPDKDKRRETTANDKRDQA